MEGRSIIRSIQRACCGLLQTGSIVLLVLVYFFGTIEVESLHSLSHHNDSPEVHTVETEIDPCHISLFHEQIADGCEHGAHITAETKCSFCDVQLHNTHLPGEVIVDSTFISFSAFSSPEDSNSPDNFVSFAQGRAPPVV